MLIICSTTALVSPPRKGKPSPENYAPPSPTSSPSNASLSPFHFSLALNMGWDGINYRLSSMMACHLVLSCNLHAFTFQFVHNWEQVIQNSRGKSALWWEQKCQMGKCAKLSGGKCAIALAIELIPSWHGSDQSVTNIFEQNLFI